MIATVCMSSVIDGHISGPHRDAWKILFQLKTGPAAVFPAATEWDNHRARRSAFPLRMFQVPVLPRAVAADAEEGPVEL